MLGSRIPNSAVTSAKVARYVSIGVPNSWLLIVRQCLN